MNQYLTFFIAHWEYTLLFIAAFVWVMISEINDRKSKLWSVQPQKAIELINKQSALIFDLRDAAAFSQGHIVGAKRIDFKASDDPKTLLKITPKTTCLLVCAVGQTSNKIVSSLRHKGYEAAYALTGGMAAWEKENLPTTKGK